MFVFSYLSGPGVEKTATTTAAAASESGATKTILSFCFNRRLTNCELGHYYSHYCFVSS